MAVVMVVLHNGLAMLWDRARHELTSKLLKLAAMRMSSKRAICCARSWKSMISTNPVNSFMDSYKCSVVTPNGIVTFGLNPVCLEVPVQAENAQPFRLPHFCPERPNAEGCTPSSVL